MYFIADYFINRKRINNNFIAKIGENSVGIYLYHWLVMIIVLKLFDIANISKNMLIYHLLLAPIVFSVTYLIYINIIKIKSKMKKVE